ncbi:NADH-quinone oxidoreductase subunit J [Nonomuraea sp. NPDC048826]|uniref:NADH-quinone oxidoreductase subunit J family protein n=1 Tax=Nonomuraea sp. NPDC048826 TaxID=3364347 RepID=UPI00371F8A72
MTEAVPSYLSPTGQEIVFLLLGAVAVGSALLVVTTKQLVHAALWLVVAFGALAGCYLVLTAEFVAWVQVLIYVGAVVVLLLFGIMLTRAPVGRSADLDSGNRWVAAVVAVATAGVLVTVVIDGFRTAYTPLTPGTGAAGELGASIFSTWVLPFEALSVLLLAALIGAIVLSRTDIPGGAPAGPVNGPTHPDVGGAAPVSAGPRDGSAPTGAPDPVKDPVRDIPGDAAGPGSSVRPDVGGDAPGPAGPVGRSVRADARGGPSDASASPADPSRTGTSGGSPPDQTGGH